MNEIWLDCLERNERKSNELNKCNKETLIEMSNCFEKNKRSLTRILMIKILVYQHEETRGGNVSNPAT